MGISDMVSRLAPARVDRTFIWVAQLGGAMPAATSPPAGSRLLLAAALACAATMLSLLQPWHQQRCSIAAAGAAAAAGPGAPHPALAAEEPPPPPPRCELAVEQSPWAAHCQRLQQVCLDYSTLIHYDPAYQQQGDRVAGRLPKLKVSLKKAYKYPWYAGGEGGSNVTTASSSSSQQRQQPRRMAYELKEAHATRHLAAPRQRPASALEPTPYLQSPAFSTCTVPVLLGVTWGSNLWHTMANAAVWHAMARRTPWRRHLKPVVMTPEGLALTDVEAQLLPPLSPLSLQTLADFSNRLPPGHMPGAAATADSSEAGAPPASHEGGEQRCFQDLFVCGREIKVDHWSWQDALGGEEARAGAGAGTAAGGGSSETEPAAAGGGDGGGSTLVPRELFGWGQAVARHVLEQRRAAQAAQLARRQRVQMPEALVVGLEPRPAGGGEGGSSDAAAGGTQRLRVVFLQRDGEGRQLLNAEELLERCNAWRYEPAGSGTTFAAECRQARTPTVAEGVAVAQEADVLVGMHGANMANAFFMRPGSSVVELMPYQYEQHPGANSLSVFNAQDLTSQLLWWVAVVCDATISQPGPAERARVQPSKFWPRERSTRLPWVGLEEVLREIAVVNSGSEDADGGSALSSSSSAEGSGSPSSSRRQRYLRDYYAQQRHRFHVDSAGVMGHGQSCPASARAET